MNNQGNPDKEERSNGNQRKEKIPWQAIYGLPRQEPETEEDRFWDWLNILLGLIALLVLCGFLAWLHFGGKF